MACIGLWEHDEGVHSLNTPQMQLQGLQPVAVHRAGCARLRVLCLLRTVLHVSACSAERLTVNLCQLESTDIKVCKISTARPAGMVHEAEGSKVSSRTLAPSAGLCIVKPKTLGQLQNCYMKLDVQGAHSLAASAGRAHPSALSRVFHCDPQLAWQLLEDVCRAPDEGLGQRGAMGNAVWQLSRLHSTCLMRPGAAKTS